MNRLPCMVGVAAGVAAAFVYAITRPPRRPASTPDVRRDHPSNGWELARLDRHLDRVWADLMESA